MAKALPLDWKLLVGIAGIVGAQEISSSQVAPVNSYNSPGFSSCPCIDTSIGKWRTALDANAHSSGSRDWLISKEPTFESGSEFTVRSNYGSSVCRNWDDKTTRCRAQNTDDLFNEASGARKLNRPSWCASLWCFVDPVQCSKQNPSRTKMFPSSSGLYYSYETCGNINVYDESEYTLQMSRLERIYVSYPMAGWPGVLSDESDPVLKQAIAFGLSMLQRFGRIIVHQNVSALSSAKHSSSYTACVHDVALGLADVCLADFWDTTERRILTSLSSPVFTQDLYLIVKVYAKSDLVTTLRKPFKPFSDGLWLMIAGVVVGIGVILAFLDYGQNDDDFPDRRPHAIAAKSTYFAIVGCVSGGVVHNPRTPAARIVAIGYGFFLLVVLASFTANTATFLMASATQPRLESIDDAINQKKKVCILLSIAQTLVDKTPQVAGLLVRKETINDVFQGLAHGECEVIVEPVSSLDWYRSKEKFCDYAAVGKPVLSLPEIIPVRSGLEGAVSWAITDERIKGGWTKAQMEYPSPGDQCPSVESRSDDELQLHPSDMLGTCIGMLICSLVALALTCLCKTADASGVSEKAGKHLSNTANTASSFRSRTFSILGIPTGHSQDEESAEGVE